MTERRDPMEWAEQAAFAGDGADDVLACLEVAAALGPDVLLGEWIAACGHLGLDCGEEVVEALVSAELARRDGEQWSFVEPEFVDALGRSSSRNGRWKRQRAACARALYEYHSQESPEVASRRATHLVEAGKLEAALSPLLVAERFHYDRGDYARAEATLDEYDQILDSIDPDRTDPRRGQSLWRRGRLLFTQGARDEAIELVERGEKLLESSNLPSERGQAALHSGRILRDMGALEDARDKLRIASQCFGEAGDDRGLALSRAGLGMVELGVGDAKAAIQAFERARATLEALEEPHVVANLLVLIAQSWHYLGDRLRATSFVEQARDVARACDDTLNEAGAWNFEGEMARDNADWGFARRCYGRAARLYEQLGVSSEHIVRFNFALAEIGAENFAEADEILTELEPTYLDIGFGGRLPLVFSALTTTKAALGEYDGLDAYLTKLERSLSETGIAHHDVLEQLERTRELLDASEHPELARRISERAATQTEALDGT